MNKKKMMSFTTVGGSSILTIFAVLCFIIFALLSLSTAKANSLLANKTMDATADFYKADMRAEEILADIRAGQCPAGVTKNESATGPEIEYSYACPVDDNQELRVRVIVTDGKYTILQWQKQYIGTWEADTTIQVFDDTQEIVE